MSYSQRLIICVTCERTQYAKMFVPAKPDQPRFMYTRLFGPFISYKESEYGSWSINDAKKLRRKNDAKKFHNVGPCPSLAVSLMARKSSNDFFDVGTFWSIVKHLKKVDVKRRACTVKLFAVVINKRVITTLYH